jgi:hypothetical protein
MENFKQVNLQNEDFYNDFCNFAIKSKPFPISRFKSIKFLKAEIKNWFDFLCKDSVIYQVSNSELKLYIFVENRSDNIYLPFLFFINNNDYQNAFEKPPPTLKTLLLAKQGVSLWHRYLIYISNKFDKKNIIADVMRTHKRKAMIDLINRYDKIAEIRYDKKNTTILWTHERLNQNSRNE